MNKEEETIIIEKLEQFFTKVEACFLRPAHRSDGMILYYLLHIVAALKSSDANEASVIKSWLDENLEKLHQQQNQLREELRKLADEEGQSVDENIHHKNSEEIFSRHIQKINADLEHLLNPASGRKIASGTNLNSYLDFVLAVKF